MMKLSLTKLWQSGFLAKLKGLGISAYFVILSSSLAQAQISLSYSTFNPGDLGQNTTTGKSDSLERGYIELGYDFSLLDSFTLTPSFGLWGTDKTVTTTLSDPAGYTLGLWGQYDLQTYGIGSTYALGGLTYLDYEYESQSQEVIGSELQFALGVGADLDLRNGVSAFTNLNYVFGEQEDAPLGLGGEGTDLKIGIEFNF